MKDHNRGQIKNTEAAEQIRDFSGLRFDKITPTDIDGLIDFQNNIFIFFELKFKYDILPYGQQLALTRIVDAVQASQKEAILFIAIHTTPYHEKIPCADAFISRHYYKKKWKQYELGQLTLKTAITKFKNYISKSKEKR